MKSRILFVTALLLITFIITLSQVASAAGGYVVLQTADPSCADDSGNIYVDCGNGTVTDNRTGLVWLQNAGCFWNEEIKHDTATKFAQGLSDLPDDLDYADCGLSDGSSPGEWRLPSISELLTMASDAIGEDGDPDCTKSPPTITNDSGLGCWISGPSSFINVGTYYWSSTMATWDSGYTPFYIWLTNGTTIQGCSGDCFFGVWPVRGGQ